MAALSIRALIESDPSGVTGHAPCHNLRTMITPDARGLAYDGTWHLPVKVVGWMIE
jgi:hypothetical protein